MAGSSHGVVIVGAGLGGLTAALALHAKGFACRVLEREAGLAAAGGAVQLGPNAVRVLFALGLEAPLRRIGSAPRAVVVRRGRDGRELLSTPMEGAERRWGAPYLQVVRSDLQALLAQTLAVRAPGALRLGAAVAQASASGEVRLASGETLSADAVVAADGLWSPLAATAFPGPPPRPLGQTAWRALIPAGRLDPAWLVPETQVRIGRGGHLVTYPVRGGSALNLVAVVEDGRRFGGEAGSWTAAGDPQALAAAFADWVQPAPALLAALERDAVWRGALHDRPPRPRWTAGRLALLGDAAHPMSPSFAQGAGMAIEDAWTLAASLSETGTEEGSVERGLEAYATARRPRTARVQAQSRRNGAVFHLPEALSSPLLAAAGRVGGGDGLKRFDWLYGDGPIPASSTRATPSDSPSFMSVIPGLDPGIERDAPRRFPSLPGDEIDDRSAPGSSPGATDI